MVLSAPGKKDVNLKVSGKALMDMSSALKAAKEKADADATVAGDLKLSKLDGIDDWLVSVANEFLKREQELLSQGLARVSGASGDIDKALHELPDLKDEVAFREAAVKILQKIATAANKLELDVDLMKENLAAAQGVMSIAFSEQVPDSQLCLAVKDQEASKELLQKGRKASCKAGCVVALVATLCLLRSPALAAASPSAADFEKLKDVAATLQTKTAPLKENVKDGLQFDKDLVAMAEKIAAESLSLLKQQKSVKNKTAEETCENGMDLDVAETDDANADQKDKKKDKKKDKEKDKDKRKEKEPKDKKGSGKGKDTKAATDNKNKEEPLKTAKAKAKAKASQAASSQDDAEDLLAVPEKPKNPKKGAKAKK